MAKNNEDKPKSAGNDVTVDRRSVLAGAAAAALTGARPDIALGQTKTPITASIFAGVYVDPQYLNQFNTKTYANPAAVHKKIHDVLYKNNRAGLRWGDYQTKLEPDYSKWGTNGKAAFDNWPIFAGEMRDNLEKQQPFLKNPENAMNPSDTSLVARNFRDHLDEAIRIALWDPPGVRVKIGVITKKRRHHGLATEWDTNPPVHWGTNPNLTLKTLTIKVECPDGGWQGFASWRNPTPNVKPITKLVAKWKVPPPPTNNNGPQIIFIFNGLESLPASGAPGGILQPVLQWTKDGWFMRSWYVTSTFDPVSVNNQLPPPSDTQPYNATATRCYSKALPVQVGATITGLIEGGKDANGKFNYKCSIDNGTDKLELPVTDVPELIDAVCVIESYDVQQQHKRTDYPDYPNPITFSSIDLQVLQTSLNPIPWTPNKKQGKDYLAAPNATGRRIDIAPT